MILGKHVNMNVCVCMCIGRASGFWVLAIDEECTPDTSGADIDSPYPIDLHTYMGIILRKHSIMLCIQNNVSAENMPMFIDIVDVETRRTQSINNISLMG